ncbi:MAG: hypothetical protein ABIK37_00245 [candidate division WOR-3 bacterium]
MPRLHAMQLDYGSHGFTSITVNLQDDWPTILTYARQYASLYLKDNGTVWPVYRQNGYIPTNYVIDTSGIIRYVTESFNEAAMRAVIEQWLPDQIDHDVGVKRIVAPSGSVDSGTVVVPACTVYNYRSYTETYPVRMRIGTAYDTTVMVTAHAPNTARYIEFPSWTALTRGQLAVTCTTELSGDDIATNDRQTGLVNVNVYDLAVTAILAPGDSVDSGAVVVPMAEIRNLGTVADMVKLRFTIGNGYLDSASIPLQPGRCDTAVLRSWIALEPGTFAVRCTVWGRWEMRPENNVLTGTVRVVGAGGIEEAAGGEFGLAGAATVVRGVLHLGLQLAADGSRLELLDATGRKVMALKPGANDVSALPPGVYYCRVGAGATRRFVKAE